MKHLTDEQLSARLDGELPAKQAAAVERHLGECAACRERLAALAGADASLARALERDPGEAYFGSFADRVQARIASGAAAGAREAPADAPPARPGWFSRPATLAWAGATASLVLVGVFAIRTALQEPASSRVAAQRPLVAADQLEPRAAAPTQAGAPESAPMAAAPAPGAAKDLAPSDAREGAVTSEGATAQDAAPRRAVAPPQRLQELQTLPNGEQVPVRTRALPGAEPRRSFAVPPADASKIRKPVALPMAPKEQTKQVVVTQEETAAGASQADESKLGLATPAPVAKRAETLAPAPAPTAFGNAVTPGTYEYASGRLCGTVRNAQGRAIEGATITIVETGRSVQSGRDGSFCVEAPAASATLAVLALGYAEHREKVSGADEARPLAVALRSVETVGRDDSPVARLKTEAPPLAAAESSRSAAPTWGKSLSYFGGPGRSSTTVAPAPAPTAETARAASLAARVARRAPLWAKAGEMWAAVAAGARTDAEADEARWQAADARMNAWRLAPTARNRIEALGAVNDYLSKAPAGPRRDAAEGWKGELPLR